MTKREISFQECFAPAASGRPSGGSSTPDPASAHL